ncbi:methyltransferase domain-containing protein [Enhygromyxa salina]
MFATLNGRRIDKDTLSEGQRVLLRWAQLIHEEVADLRDAILLIDEPELHLHPHALIEAITRLAELHPAQIWVATHSIPLLAWIGPRHIYSMDQGRPSWAGNQMKRVLGGLLGENDGTERLRTFLTDAGSLAFHQFAAECLLAAGVLPLRDGDPQAAHFVTHISELLQAAEQDVRVLEYGAGRGRLIEAIAALPTGDRARLRYHVYNDPEHTDPADASTCRAQLARLEGSEVTHRYCDDLRQHQLDAADKMDAVVLCNVLHEVSPQDWPRLMDRLRACLRPDGHLLILEDQQMSVGELPHDAGYIVLDEVELCALFNAAAGTPLLRYGQLHAGRLSIAEISAQLLVACTPDCVNKALKQVQQRALDQITTLRRPKGPASPAEPGHRRGRLHAYYALLHTNATLARSDA